MKTALFSLIIATSVALLSLLQFNRYQTFSNSTHASLGALENKINLGLAGLKDEVTNLKASEAVLLSRMQNLSFKRAELEYLISLASARLQTTRDFKAAIALLTLAHTKIQTLEDLSLSPLSQALEKDIITLQQAATLNLEDVFLKISSLLHSTALMAPKTLTTPLPPQAAAPKPPAPAEQTQKPNLSRLSLFKNRLLQSATSIQDLVKIRHAEHPIEPLLSETQKNLIQQNLQSLFEEMRLALLLTEDKIFQKALQETQQWLSRYYDETDPLVKKIQDTLTELSAIPLRPALPIITALEFFNTLR